MNSHPELRILGTLLFLLPAVFYASAQSNLRRKVIPADTAAVSLDTLSVIPGTVSVKWMHGDTLRAASYRLDYVNARLTWNVPFSAGNPDSLVVTYKVFPFLFSQKYQHKDLSRIQNNRFGEPYVYTYDKSRDVDFFKTEGLTKSGSIARGISFGNNQDVVLNSSLNLQLAGKLSENMDLLLAATDQNIPIQPEGNTQQLQEFDKVFIQLGIKDLPSRGKTTVTAGDFQIGKPKGYFMNFNKKLQGLSFLSQLAPFARDTAGRLAVTASAAVSKGKFARNVSSESPDGNTFNGFKQERNQGPYKLRGAENEQFIIALAGTEAVYLDGRLLERGQENDYTINYNTAEVFFTPKNLITKDKRIEIEFQYSDKNYARSLIHAGTEYENKRISARVNFFSEQDNKNKPLQQELSKPQKLLLSGIGDSLQHAVWPSADSIAFNGTEVLYLKKDTLIHSSFYSGIYVYSTDSTRAHYRLSFSYVGEEKGNYILKQADANGKVYEWIRPDTATGRPKGDYEPVILLIAPKQKQMATAGIDWKVTQNSILSLEGAVSKNDINTFSAADKANDAGFAGKMAWEGLFPLGPDRHLPHPDSSATGKPGNRNAGWNLLTNLNYEYVQKTFSPIERFRNVEFDRDWNRGNIPQEDDQHIIGGKIGLVRQENNILYDYKSFLEGTLYNGAKQAVNLSLTKNGFLFTADGSYLNSKSAVNQTNFLRSRASLGKKFLLPHSRKVNIGIRELQERNRITYPFKQDSLIAGSAQFYEWEPFAEFSDSLNNKYTLTYKQRTDYALKNSITSYLKPATFAENLGGGIELMSHPSSQLRLNGSYRRLQVLDTSLTIQKAENTVVGRTEYNFSAWKGFVTSAAFYEIGSGLESRKQFIFLEVAPGKGTHVWKDYNSDGIKQQNEFEISPFPNEANYIKLWTPTSDYISTYTNQFSEVLSVNPASRWNGKRGIKNLLSRFSDQTAYRTDKKTTNTDLGVAYNPFLSDTKDKTLITINSSFRNTVFFNQSAPVFGIDYTFQDVRNKTLLENDTSSRQQQYQEIHLRWNANRQWTFQTTYTEGVKKNNSEFFSTRNYRIAYTETEPKVSFQPNSSFRATLSYKFSEKKNTLALGYNPQAKTALQNLGGEIKYNAVNRGSLSARANLISVTYNDDENTPLAFEMLEGLKTGKNYTWNVSYSQTLASNIQLTLSYDGRQSPGVRTIHTGNAQVKAFF